MQSQAQSRLRQLYEAHAREATRFAYFLTGELATAEDLVQDAFLRIAGRLGHLRRAETFEVYLRRVPSVIWVSFSLMARPTSATLAEFRD